MHDKLEITPSYGLNGPNTLHASQTLGEQTSQVLSAHSSAVAAVAALSVAACGGGGGGGTTPIAVAKPSESQAAIRCDTDGNVWCGWGWGGMQTNGVRVHHPDGTMLASWASAEPISSEIATDMMVESFIGSPLFMRSLKMICPSLNIVITFNVHDNHESSAANPRVNDSVLTLHPSVN